MTKYERLRNEMIKCQDKAKAAQERKDNLMADFFIAAAKGFNIKMLKLTGGN